MSDSPPRPRIIFEDDHLLAVVKPAGLPTANAARGQSSLHTLLQQERPRSFIGVVSRLDAAVSGVVVLAKTPRSAAALAGQFRERLVEKRYEAVVEGRFPAALGAWVDWTDIVERVGTDRRSRLVRDARMPTGGEAGPPGDDAGEDGPGDGDAGPAAGGLSHVRARVVVRRGEVSLVELVPSTGRRHQLRAQLAGRGCPIVGDRTYGARLPFLPAPRTAIALRSAWLLIRHPETGAPLELEAERPAAWQQRFPGLFGAGGRSRPADG